MVSNNFFSALFILFIYFYFHLILSHCNNRSQKMFAKNSYVSPELRLSFLHHELGRCMSFVLHYFTKQLFFSFISYFQDVVCDEKSPPKILTEFCFIYTHGGHSSHFVLWTSQSFLFFASSPIERKRIILENISNFDSRLLLIYR
jgi:hypothetical protein